MNASVWRTARRDTAGPSTSRPMGSNSDSVHAASKHDVSQPSLESVGLTQTDLSKKPRRKDFWAGLRHKTSRLVKLWRNSREIVENFQSKLCKTSRRNCAKLPVEIVENFAV